MNIITKLSILCLCLSAANYASFAQQQTPVYPDPQAVIHRWSVSTSPISPLDPIEPSFSLHGLYAVNERLSIGLETGVIYHYAGSGEDWNGWRLRPEIRFTQLFHTRYGSSSAYLSIQGMIKKLERPASFEQTLQTTNGTTYYHLADTRIRKLVTGINVLFGKELYLFNNPNLFIDIYAGMGIRYKSVSGEPDNAKEKGGIDLFNFRNKSGLYPSFPLGIRAGWKF